MPLIKAFTGLRPAPGQATAVAVPAADFQMLAVPDGVDDEAALLLTDNLNTGWIGGPYGIGAEDLAPPGLFPPPFWGGAGGGVGR